MKAPSLKGTEVKVECFGGVYTQMLVIEELGDVILICSPDELRAAQREQRTPVTIGFKRESVVQEDRVGGKA